jgi:hypothetical protein
MPCVPLRRVCSGRPSDNGKRKKEGWTTLFAFFPQYLPFSAHRPIHSFLSSISLYIFTPPPSSLLPSIVSRFLSPLIKSSRHHSASFLSLLVCLSISRGFHRSKLSEIAFFLACLGTGRGARPGSDALWPGAPSRSPAAASRAGWRPPPCSAPNGRPSRPDRRGRAIHLCSPPP